MKHPLSSIYRLSSLLLAVLLGYSSAFAAGLETLEEGTLTVAFNGDMPGTGWQDGKLIGLDGEIMQMIASNLGLKLNHYGLKVHRLGTKVPPVD